MDLPEDDADEAALRREGERIAALIDDLGDIGGAPVRQRLEELVQRLVHLYGAGLGRLLHILGGDQLDPQVRARLQADPLVSSLLVLHGIHPAADAARAWDPDAPGAAQAPAQGLVQIDRRRHVAAKSGSER
jgi:hypothetical protein